MTVFTADFKTAATAQVRDPRALVEILWGNTLSDKNLTITSNQLNYVNRAGQVKNDAEDSGQKWAFLGYEIVADGSFHPMPDTDDGDQVGWFGTSFSDSSGNFTGTAPYIELEHDSRPYSLIKIVGDSEYNEHPVDFEILLYQSAVLAKTIVVTGNSNRIYETLFDVVPDVTKVKIEFSKWSAPNTTIKIIQVSGSAVVEYDGGDIVEIGILEETNSDIGGVPIGSISANELDVTLVNSDRRFSYGNTDSPFSNEMVPGKRVRVWLGFALPSGSTDATGDVDDYIVNTELTEKIGYMPYGVYYSEEFKSSFSSIDTTINTYDLVYKLGENEFVKSETYFLSTLNSIVNRVMMDAKKVIPNLQWEVHPDISTKVWLETVFEKKSYLDTIKDICLATATFAYMDRNGVLIIGSKLNINTPVDSHQEIGLSEYESYKSDSSFDELANTVRVGYSVYDLQPSQLIYNDETEFEIQSGETQLNFYITWENSPVKTDTVVVTIDRVSGNAVLVASEIYAYGADVEVVGVAGDTFTVTANGQYYEITENTEVTVSNSESVKKYGSKELSITGNKLIDSPERAESIANSILDFYGNPRQDALINWRGDTLSSIGDTLEITEFKSDTVEAKDYFIIKRQNITFDGGLTTETELRRG